jgi:hypothetical protein
MVFVYRKIRNNIRIIITSSPYEFVDGRGGLTRDGSFPNYSAAYMSGEQEWRDVCGYGGIYVGLYQISNDGCVRRVKGGQGAKAGRVLKPGPNSCGYRTVDLYADGNRSKHTVHRLVAEAFIPNPDDKCQVDHINRDKLNNHVSNLRWATQSENNINVAGRSNTGKKHICRTLYRGKPVFRVAIKRDGKIVVQKRFYINDTDEGDALAEADAYRREKYAELGIEVDDRQAHGSVVVQKNSAYRPHHQTIL